MISLTNAAVDKIKSLGAKEQPQNDSYILRVSVKGGGCSGLNYVLDFVDNADIRDTDEHLEFNGLKVICDPKSLSFIDDTVIDFDTNLLSMGFKYLNPKSKKSCSCGESFTPG